MSESPRSQEVRIATMGCRWRIDLSALDPQAGQRLRELWARAGWPADTTGAAPGSLLAALAPDEPPGFPRTLRAAHTAGSAADGSGGAFVADILVDRRIEVGSYQFSTALTQHCLAAQAGRMTLLHSAALAHPDSGACVILIAGSGTGKTTAARLLGRRLGYLSDETAAIRADGTLIAHPKPLSVIPTGGGRKVELSPDEAGLLRPPSGPLRLAATIVLSRDPSCAEPVLEAVDLFSALAEIIPQSSSVPLQDSPLETLATAVTAGAGVHRLRYAEMAQAAPLVLDLLAAGSRAQPAPRTWVPMAPPQDRRTGPWAPYPAAAVSGCTRAVERSPWRDALHDPGQQEVFLLNGPKPVRLMGIGATLWLACEQPRTVAELVDVTIERHGAHPQARELVLEALARLSGEGLVRPAG